MFRVVIIMLVSISSSIYGNFYTDLFDRYPDGPPSIPWKHITQLQIIHGKFLVGYHWQGNIAIDQPRVFEVKLPDIFGIYKATVFYEGLTKISTFFPLDWTEEDIEKCIVEAYKNQIYKNENHYKYGFVGETCLGIRCQFWFDFDSKGNVYLSSVYPRKRSIDELVKLYDENANFKVFADKKNNAEYDLSKERTRKKFFYSFHVCK